MPCHARAAARRISIDNVGLFKSKAKVLKKHLDTPVLPDSWHQTEASSATVGLVIFLFLQIKKSTGMKDSAFDMICWVIRHILLPKPNLFPPSRYLMLESIGVPHPDKYMRQCCAAEKHSWDPLPRKQWEHHIDDKCECGLPRFEKISMPNGNHLGEAC